MDISYFQKINNTYNAKSKQEVDLYLLNKHIDDHFADTIDYHVVKRNGEPFELLIIKDTDGNTFKKKIKSKHSTPFNLGDYIEWNNQIWLVTLLDPNEKTYHSGYMYLCTVPLRWQNSEGKIIERYAYSEDFTKYSTGVTGNNTIQIGENQYGLTLPIDSETKKLRRDLRFPIDFDDAEQPDVYDLTNRKVNLNNNEYFGRGGIMVVTMSFGAFNATNDKKVTLEDGKEVWICDYKEVNDTPSEDPTTTPENPDEMTDLWHMKLKYSTLKIKPLNKKYTINAHLYDGDGNEITEDVEYEWNVVSDVEGLVENYVTWDDEGNVLTISLSTDCEDFGELITISCMSKYTGQSDEIQMEVMEVW